MIEEIWVPVTGYEKYYEVSSLCRVRSLRGTPKILNLRQDYKVSLHDRYHRRKHVRSYKLAAQEFLTNPDNLPNIKRVDNNVYSMKWIRNQNACKKLATVN